jgi:subfamily B ATP-binding cassette protein MsbA
VTPPPGPFPAGGALARIWAFSVGRRRRLLGVCALVVLATAATLALPLGMRALLDRALSGERRLLDWLAVGLLAVFAVRAAVAYLGQYEMRVIGEEMIARLRTALYAHLHALDLGFHSRQRVGDLTSRLASDTDSVRALLTDVLVSAALHAFQLAGSFAVMWALNWRLALVMLAMAPLATLLSRAFSPALQRRSREVQDRMAAASSVAQETLAAMPVVHAFARSGWEVRRYGDGVAAVVAAVRGLARQAALFSSAATLLFAISSVALFWVGGHEVLAGRSTAGDLVAFLFYSQNISQCITVLSGHYASLAGAVGASQRVFEILDTAPEVVEAKDARPLLAAQGALRFERVSFAYPSGRTVLHDVSFAVAPGESVAVVGASGAGKTTLLHLIPRLADPRSGRVLVDGHDVRGLQLRSLREQVAIVSQDVTLFSASVRDNIAYGREGASPAQIEAAAREADAHAFIVALPGGYDAQVGERGVRLSGGQRQRLSIARALLKDARILILDEATSWVDRASEAAIQESLERLSAGRTIVRVTHRLTGLGSFDRILVLDGGRLVESGTERELLARGGVFARLANAGHEQEPEPSLSGAG